ncbi:putative cell wall protein [Aspergillus melleus]|uniref:putative cell wall protein n=1 Tax=Aspergillus melleus TaxID=138277 RepID=UPI001E8E8457|nr:uncharacterized protein LDX57_004460 [Aspergillus melleus]KAH8426727.1 hypothetical protein LDX57_004460 [Aspergillus melleus]
MRSNNLLLLASLASYGVALPTADLESRTFGLIPGIVSGVAHDLTGLIGLLLGDGGHTPATILSGISARAAAALEGGALGCKAGDIHAHARAELAAWVRAHADLHLEASLKTALLDWCDGEESATLSVGTCAGLSLFIPTCADIAAKGDLYVTIDGIFSTAELAAEVVLNASAQTHLSAFIKGSIGAALDAKIKAGLGLCAGGGVVTDLSADIKAALKVWLHGSDCSLSASLKASVIAWLEGKLEGEVVHLGSLPTGGVATISAGAAVEALIEESGALSASAQASLAAFLKSDVSAGIEGDIETALNLCIKGGLASSLDIEVRTALATWLSGSSCRLGAELKSVLILWLSFAVSGEVSIDIHSGIISELTSFLEGTVETTLGGSIRGIISLLISGESFINLSLEARAQLVAICGGAASVEIDSHIQLILIGIISGCDTGAGTGTNTGSSSSGVPSIPAVTPSGSSPVIPGASSTAGVPGVSTPGVPEGPAPTGTAPAGGDVPSGTAPVEATSTPCDTLTSQNVVPIVTGSESVPTGTAPAEQPAPSGTAPSGGDVPAPSGTVPAGGNVPSGTAPAGGDVPAPSGTAPSGGEVPVPSGGASTTPCDTLTSETVVPIVTGSEGVPTGTAPAGGEVPAPTGTAPSGVSPTDSVSVPEGPAPTGTAPAGGEVPVPSGGASSTPCDTLTSETVIPIVTGSDSPAPTGPAGGEVPAHSGTVPAGGNVPSGTAPAGGDVPAPTGTAPAGGEVPVPSGGASSTPCDTLTSETVVPIVTGSEGVPTGTAPVEQPAPSGTAPAGGDVPAPSGTAPAGGDVPSGTAPVEATSTPCDTLTSQNVVPIVTGSDSPAPTAPAEQPAPSGTAPVGGEVPVPSEGASTTPCDTLTSQNVVPIVTGSDSPAPTAPAEQPAPSGTAPAGGDVPAPSGTAPAGGEVPAPSGGASTTPCDTLTSQNVVPIATKTDAPAPSGPTGVSPEITTAPVPAASSGPGPKVVTITTTVSVSACEL